MDYLVHGILQARILEWVAFPFSKGSSQPSDRTQVFHTAGRFFASWAPREAQEHWSGYLIPSPGDLPDPGIKPGSPALQTDSLLTELWGKPNLLKLILLFLFTPGTNPMEQAVLSSSSCNWGNRRVLFIYFIFDCPGCLLLRGLSPVAARGTTVSAACRRLLFWSTGSRCSRSVLVVLGLSCPEARGIFRDLGLNYVLPKVVAFPKLIFCQKFSPSSHVQRIC